MVPDSSDDAELERFQLFVSSHLAPLPATAPLPAAFGPWVSIVSAAAKTALALGSVRGGEAVVKQDTALLRQGPLKTAMTYMAEARRVGPGDERPGTGIGFQGRGKVIDGRPDRLAVGDDRRRKGLNATLNASYGLAKGYADFLTLGTAMAAQAAVDLRIRRRRLEVLEQFLHFVNAVEVSADEASGRTASMILRLEAEKAPVYKGGRYPAVVVIACGP